MTTHDEQQVGSQGRWTFDPYHTQVEFAAKHLGMMTVRGNFLEITADGNIYPDNPEASSVDVTIQTASIRTHNAQRDNDIMTCGHRIFLKRTRILRCYDALQKH